MCVHARVHTCTGEQGRRVLGPAEASLCGSGNSRPCNPTPSSLAGEAEQHPCPPGDIFSASPGAPSPGRLCPSVPSTELWMVALCMARREDLAVGQVWDGVPGCQPIPRAPKSSADVRDFLLQWCQAQPRFCTQVPAQEAHWAPSPTWHLDQVLPSRWLSLLASLAARLLHSSPQGAGAGAPTVMVASTPMETPAPRPGVPSGTHMAHTRDLQTFLLSRNAPAPETGASSV